MLVGYGQEKGGISCVITNSYHEEVTVVYMETVPWFLRVYFHTLKVEAFVGTAENSTTLKPRKCCRNKSALYSQTISSKCK